MIIILKVIAGLVGYIIISIVVTILLIYLDRKEGKSAQEVYKEDDFYEYYVVGFLFPLSLPCLIIGVITEGICKFIKIMCVSKFIKIMCVTIVETKIAIESEDEK